MPQDVSNRAKYFVLSWMTCAGALNCGLGSLAAAGGLSPQAVSAAIGYGSTVPTCVPGLSSGVGDTLDDEVVCVGVGVGVGLPSRPFRKTKRAPRTRTPMPIQEPSLRVRSRRARTAFLSAWRCDA